MSNCYMCPNCGDDELEIDDKGYDVKLGKKTILVNDIRRCKKCKLTFIMVVYV